MWLPHHPCSHALPRMVEYAIQRNDDVGQSRRGSTRLCTEESEVPESKMPSGHSC